MEKPIPHLLIKEGPEMGREIVIPADGARMGRSEENDIVIADAAMSRFQCRMYFREGFLHLMDLGSTNESLVNNKPVSDVALRFGDEILIGESILKVLNDGLHERSGSAISAAPQTVEAIVDVEPAPIIFNMEGEDDPSNIHQDEPEMEPAHPSSVNVDLGLGRREELEGAKEKGAKGANLSLILVTLITMLIVFVICLLVLRNSIPPPVQIGAEDEGLRVHYEKVIAGDGNIFRYALNLSDNGSISAEVHDLRQQRNIVREETVNAEQIMRLKNQLLGNKDSFLGLQDEYEGLPVGAHESFMLTVIYGNEAKTVRVSNQLEPDIFKQVREQIEAFANNEIGLINFQIPPEELRKRAGESWKNAQELYSQRDVKNRNLWEATQKLKDVIFLLETIEPKPAYYQDAVTLRQEWRKNLIDKIGKLEFEAVRQNQLGETRRAIELNQRILATLPEATHKQYKEAFNRLNQMSQELN